jgi:hypothetical protein
MLGVERRAPVAAWHLRRQPGAVPARKLGLQIMILMRMRAQPSR